jgi:hypothetical protein
MFVVVITANVVENVLDLQWSPSNLHIHPLQNANAPHPLKLICHVPSKLLGSTLAAVSFVAMSYVVFPTSTPSIISLMEMSYVVLL